MKNFLAFLLLFALAFLPAVTVHAREQQIDCIKASKLSDEAAELAASNAGLAERKIREAVELCDSSASLHYNLALISSRQFRFTDAEAELERAIELKPDFARAINALALLYPLKPDGDLAEAKKLAQKAVNLDPRNRQYRQTVEMLNASVDFPPRTTVTRPDAIAVVIGNRNYRSAAIPAVTYAVQDAIAIRKYLTEALGFKESNIIYLTDAAHVDFIRIFGDAGDHKGILYNRTRKDRSDIFIYYSGHGAPDTNTKKPYLVPSDADPAIIKITGYSLDTFYANLTKLESEKQPRSITVVLDSCFSGGYNNGMLIENASPITIEASTPALTLRNAVVFSSSRGNQISSWYNEQNHGLFTYNFLKSIKTGIEQGKKGLSARDVEKTLIDADGVNDQAWRLYNREQEPQIVGNKNLILVP
jgi:caspase domain-containing protein/tetratricopeptide repeat protein